MQDSLLQPGPDLIVCDEGHRIKNNGANISKVLKNVRTKRRLVLTGYPLQVRLWHYSSPVSRQLTLIMSRKNVSLSGFAESTKPRGNSAARPAVVVQHPLCVVGSTFSRCGNFPSALCVARRTWLTAESDLLACAGGRSVVGNLLVLICVCFVQRVVTCTKRSCSDCHSGKNNLYTAFNRSFINGAPFRDCSSQYIDIVARVLRHLANR